MQLKDLVKPISEMSDEELHEHLRQIRHRRQVERPAAKARVERVERKESRGRLSALDKLLEGLSDQEKAQLLLNLEGSGANGGSTEGGSTEGGGTGN